jgi:putative transposase
LIERDHPRLSLRQQCKLLRMSRSTLNYKPVEKTQRDIEEMKRGEKTNRKRLQRLKKKMGLRTIYCRPRTSIPNEAHKKYPYLLKNRCISKPNEAWCTDITYVPMPRGHVYLCCVMDWYSRKVLGWELSDTMNVVLCQKAFQQAVKKSVALPEIFNTDQGSQFTSQEWTGDLLKRGIAISMDGKGRWRDNVYIERFWRSLKYECLFLNEYSTLPELEKGLRTWIGRYNNWRPHQALEYKTPQQVYQMATTIASPFEPQRARQLLRASPGPRGLSAPLRDSSNNGTRRGPQKLLVTNSTSNYITTQH